MAKFLMCFHTVAKSVSPATTDMRAQIQAVLFDFDGTLAPNLDLPDMRRQILHITQTFGVPPDIYADQYIVEIIDSACAWLAAQSGDRVARAYHSQAHQRILDIEMTAARITTPFTQTPAMLRTLRNNGIKLGVVTRNCRAAVLQVFPTLLAHVDELLARDDTEYLKPDPRHLSTCLAALDCAAEQAVMVGDGHLDMQVGAALQMQCIGVLTGSGDEASLQAAGAHVVLPELTATNLLVHLGFAD